FQLALALISFMRDWKLWGLPWWVWTIAVPPEAILLSALAWDRARTWLEGIGHRRNAALTLLGLISVENAFALVALLGSLVSGNETSGGQLLLKGTTIWGTNVIAFGLWFWGIDQGGPVRRLEPKPPAADFRFPQQESTRRTRSESSMRQPSRESSSVAAQPAATVLMSLASASTSRSWVGMVRTPASSLSA